MFHAFIIYTHLRCDTANLWKRPVSKLRPCVPEPGNQDTIPSGSLVPYSAELDDLTRLRRGRSDRPSRTLCKTTIPIAFLLSEVLVITPQGQPDSCSSRQCLTHSVPI